MVKIKYDAQGIHFTVMYRVSHNHCYNKKKINDCTVLRKRESARTNVRSTFPIHSLRVQSSTSCLQRQLRDTVYIEISPTIVRKVRKWLSGVGSSNQRISKATDSYIAINESNSMRRFSYIITTYFARCLQIPKNFFH